jgi:cbb3-type cytochrome oxidase cytochrome c subunit
MKAHYRTSNGRITVEVDGENIKDVFRKIAAAQEVFEAEKCCGLCKSQEIRFQHRKVEKFDYYELICRSCFACFRFGQRQEGGDLFPKRKGDDGAWLPDGGWARWERKAE